MITSERFEKIRQLLQDAVHWAGKEGYERSGSYPPWYEDAVTVLSEDVQTLEENTSCWITSSAIQDQQLFSDKEEIEYHLFNIEQGRLYNLDIQLSSYTQTIARIRLYITETNTAYGEAGGGIHLHGDPALQFWNDFSKHTSIDPHTRIWMEEVANQCAKRKNNP